MTIGLSCRIKFSSAQHGRQQLHIGNDLFRSLHQTPCEIPKEGGSSSSKGWILQWTSSGLIQQIYFDSSSQSLFKEKSVF
jgi:hypothetical protein